jgi:putative endonuclease
MDMKRYYVYIMTNRYNTVLYTGVTNNILRRVQEHRNKVDPKAFSAKYRVVKLVYYEQFNYIMDAIYREKQIKAGSRSKKIRLIESRNKEWIDLIP